MSKTRAQARADTNDRLLTEMAERVAKVMQVSHGAMSAPNVEMVRQQLEVSLSALEAYPDIDRTHGQIALQRMTSSDYMVSLNLGILMHFDPLPEEEKTDG